MKWIRHQKLWALCGFGLSVAAIVLLAAALSKLELLPGRPFSWEESQSTAASHIDSSTHDVEISDFWKTVIALGFWILIPLSILYIVISSEARKRILRDIAWIASSLLMLYLMVRALRQFLSSTPQEGGAQGSSLPPVPQEEMQAFSEFVSHPPAWLAFMMSAAFIALVLGGIWYLWQRSLHHPERPLELLAKTAQEALTDLRSGHNLKGTVMRCYHEMAQILSERRGIRRHRAMTPREFSLHLEQAGLQSEHIQKLTWLFEDVRYGAKEPGEQKEREAVLCLEAIVQAYGGTS